MPAWTWFIAALVLGGLLLTVALLADRRARRRVTGADEPAPLRDIPDVDRHVPRYVTQDQIDALPAPYADNPGPIPHEGEGFGFGHAHPDFATSKAGAELRDAWVLVVDGEVTAVRELFGPLALATAGRPLVVVAAGLHPDVVTTLAANRRALRLPIVAAVAEPRDRRRLAELVGAEPLSEADLQAGYVPETAYGVAAVWTSTPTRAWVHRDKAEPQPRT